MIADFSDLDGFIYSGIAGAALGALISVLLNFQFQKMLLRQQLEFQQRLLDQQLAAEAKDHEAFMSFLNDARLGMARSGDALRTVIHETGQAVITAIKEPKTK